MTAPPLRTHAAIAMLLLGTSENEIEKERAYTKSARALGQALQGRGLAGSPNFWNGVAALMEVSQSDFCRAL